MDGVLVDLLGSIKRHLGTTKLNQGVIDDFFYSDAGTGTEFWANVDGSLVVNNSGNSLNHTSLRSYLLVHLFVIKIRQ